MDPLGFRGPQVNDHWFVPKREVVTLLILFTLRRDMMHREEFAGPAS
jgi:hypothetical protein